MHANASTSSSISPEKLRANQENAQHSTGPRTEEGKRISSMNASSDWFFCRCLVLAGENPDEMEFIREEMLRSLRPQDVPELQIVDRIICASWKLNRMQETELLLHQAKETDVRETARFSLKELTPKMRDAELSKRMSEETARRLSELQPGEMTAAMTFACALIHGDTQLERVGRYEQRLETQILRCHAQLRAMRKHLDPDWTKLPVSPYSREYRERLIAEREEWRQRTQQASDPSTSDRDQTQDPPAPCNKIIQNPTESSISPTKIENEPTAARPNVPSDPDQPPKPSECNERGDPIRTN